MSNLPAPRGPSPWLSFAVPLAVYVVGLAVQAGTIGADMRQLDRRLTQAEMDVRALQVRANAADVTLAEIRRDLSYIREAVDELRRAGPGATPAFLPASSGPRPRR